MELTRGPEDGDACNAFALPGNHKSQKKERRKVEKDRKKNSVCMSKNQQRKLRRLQEEKDKRARRSSALEILEKHKLRDDAHALLSSSGNIGQVETMREKLSKAMRFRRAGLGVPLEIPLFRERVTDSASIESEKCTDELLAIKWTPKNNMQEVGQMQAKKRKRVALHACNSANFNEGDSKPDNVIEDARNDTSTDGKINVDSTSMAGRNIQQSDMSLDHDTETSIHLSMDRCLNGGELDRPLTSTEQNLAVTIVSVPQSNHDKALASSHPLNLGEKRGSGSASIMSQKEIAKQNVGGNESTDAIQGRKYQVSQVDGGKLDAQTSGASKEFEWAPVGTNFVVHVSRPPDVEESRKNLPIIMMEQEIMEAISHHSTVIICGETGCGKTTQVPQFLFEAGFGSRKGKERAANIGVTQPRRVAVLATTKRVAYELSFQLGKEVGFQVRHDRRIGENSSIKFMTDGILLREVQSDFLLRRYSIIVLDEAHERSLNTDILIGLLSRIVPLRQSLYDEQQRKILHGEAVSPEHVVTPLKLVLMSATLRIEDFVSNRKLFPTSPPVVEVATRQFPVTIHFSAKTELIDYLGKAHKKVLAIHKKLPPGGILVFVTGQREVEYLCRQLKKAFVERNKSNVKIQCISQKTKHTVDADYVANEPNLEGIAEAVDVIDDNGQHKDGTDRFNLFDDEEFEVHSEANSASSDVEFDSDSDSEEEECLDSVADNTWQQNSLIKEPGCLESLKAAFEALSGDSKSGKPNLNSREQMAASLDNEKQTDENSDARSREPGPLYVLPLYAMLPAAEQLRVFAGVPEGERLVVVATNVAETSLTIPGIKYVVDCGRAKVKDYNCSSGIAKYEIQWISKASAAQRAGRAGRTGPGHCYRLYSSAVFNNTFPDFPVPEICKVSIEGIVLLLKYMGINKVANFPFPTPPDRTALVEAEQCLKALSAVDQATGMLTPVGEAMALYPISPRHSRMLLTVFETVRNLEEWAGANLVLAFAIAIAAALSMDNPFLTQFSSNAVQGGQEKEMGVDALNEKGTEEKEYLQKKKQREVANAAHKLFENMTSDALTVANALRSFELAGNPGEFCRSNFLHLKTMDEMSKLRKQLLQLVFNQKIEKKLNQDFTWAFGNLADVELTWRNSIDKPLTSTQEDILGQAICAGWVDRVARRLRSDMIKASPEGKRPKAVRYQACSIEENVFVHPTSSLARLAPEFVVYNELIQTSRPYMRGVTSVKPTWLVLHARALCTFSRPLADPQPYYDCSLDEVFCFVSPTFGLHLWELPLDRSPMKSGNQRMAVFACALLQGKVLPCLKLVKNFLAADPSMVLKPEAGAQKRVSDLLHRLSAGPIIVDSRIKLKSAWEADPKFLYFEILSWLQSKFHWRFEELWEQMKHEVQLDCKQLFPKKLKKCSSV